MNVIVGGVNAVIRGINSIPNVKTPLGPIGIPDIPVIPRLARGGLVTAPGMAVVGEQGPELVRLGRGAQVIPNNQLAAGAEASQTGQHVEVPIYLDSTKIARVVVDRHGRVLYDGVSRIARNRVEQR